MKRLIDHPSSVVSNSLSTRRDELNGSQQSFAWGGMVSAVGTGHKRAVALCGLVGLLNCVFVVVHESLKMWDVDALWNRQKQMPEISQTAKLASTGAVSAS